MTKNEVNALLYELADYDIFSDYELNDYIINESTDKDELIDIYMNARKQQKNVFIELEKNILLLSRDDLNIKEFKKTFSHIWEVAQNSYYEGYEFIL